MPLFSFKAKKVEDLVCGMMIDPKAALGSAEHSSRTFYFCSVNCLGTFKQDPHRYAHASG